MISQKEKRAFALFSYAFLPILFSIRSIHFVV